MCKNIDPQDVHTEKFDEAAGLFRDGKLAEAQACYEKLLARDSGSARALHGMGVVRFHLHDIEASFEYLQRALLVQPDYATAYCSMGLFQRKLGRLLAAKISYRKALELDSSAIEILCIMGAICKELNQYELSEEYLNRALDSGTAHAPAHYEYAGLHLKMKHYDIAIEHFVKALELQPNYADACTQLALIYLSQGRQLEANTYLKTALEHRPDSLLIRGVLAFTMHYLPEVTPADVYTASTKWARLAVEAITRRFDRYDNDPDLDKVLKIGFISPDFRRHPVGYFIQSFLMLHSIDQFEVVCYSDVRGEDDLTKQLIESSDKWRRVYGVKDDKLAEMIQRDRIDILVDLTGHTKDSRLNVFVMKPAPIQITWAGYVGTTGLDAIDYLISDRFQSPEGSEEFAVERIIRMPDDYICYTPPEYAPEVAPLAALENGYITFGCFNNHAKISETAIAVWCDILKRVANSKLFVKNPSFSDQSTVDRFMLLFEKHGIPPERIRVEGQSPHPEMLERYSLVDIQLDTMPYSGGLTTLESVWMGVPVITFPGALFSSRHSLSHLMNIGLSDCVASSLEEYIAIACSMAGDVATLSEMRINLRDTMASSPVCDGFGFTENFQCVLREMWREWCEKTVKCPANDVDRTVVKGDDSGNECRGDHIAYNDQGNTYSDQGNYDAALACYKQALDIKPGYVESYFNMGLVLCRMAKQEEALRLFRLVLCLAPDFGEAYDHLAETLVKMGRTEEAQEVLEKRSALEKEGCLANNAAVDREQSYATIAVDLAGSQIEFRCHNNDLSRGICTDILNGTTYPIMPIEEDVRVIADIGANVGAASLYFKGIYPTAIIHAFEPASESFSLLRNNADHVHGIHIYNYGLSDKNDSVKLYRGTNDSVTNSVFVGQETGASEIIQLCAAAEVFNKLGLVTVDILKIDTEGCEVPILTSLADVLDSTKVIYIEYHCEEDRLTIDALLSKSHYLQYGRVNAVHRGELVYVNKAGNSLQECPLKC